MTATRFSWLCLTSMFLALPVAIAQAQTRPGGAVTVQGSGESTRPAENLRLHVEILAQGNDLEQAVERLASRRKQIAKQLEEFKMTAGTLRFDAPAIVTERFAAPELADLRPVALDFDPGAAPSPAAPSGNMRPIVSAMLTADFSLPDNNPAAALLFAERLKRQIAKVDLAGVKALDAGVACGTCGPQPGAVLVFYWRRVTPEEQSAALADAFTGARRQATRLAAAAGLDLGALRGMTTVDDASLGQTLTVGGPGVAAPVSQFGVPGGEGEVSSTSPGNLIHRATLEVTFELTSTTADNAIVEGTKSR
jgi:hypothetical protein